MSIFGLLVLISSIMAVVGSFLHIYKLDKDQGILNRNFPLYLPIAQNSTFEIEGKFAYAYPTLSLITFLFFYWYVFPLNIIF